MEKDKKVVAIYNLGCKVNHYEAEMMEQHFRENGYEIVPFEEKADIYVVNTCSVTQIADKKSRQFLARARRNNPDALVVAAGCAADVGALRREGTELCDLIVPNMKKREIVQLVEAYASGREDGLRLGEPRKEVPDEGSAAMTGCFQEGLLQKSSNMRAFIKVQDGCDQFCSYCIIPYARGRSISRSREEIVSEVEGLAARGVREIVLNGIHLSSFDGGRKEDAFGPALFALVETLSQISGLERIRLGSLEPRLIREETAEVIGRLVRDGKLCPHFHLSLQSGCDETLRRMNRHYTAKQYAQGVALLRDKIDRPAVTTDVITGFPGETEEEFVQTRRFLEELSLYEIHVFPYSRRAGTVADRMPDQLTRTVKEERSRQLLDLTAAQSKAYRTSFLGEKLTILAEEEVVLDEKRYLIGHTERYVMAAYPADRGGAPGELLTGTADGFLRDDVVVLS
ncbi:MAG: tRNA (N(6)-L-threonylcarbamoyladenosine(37)-C(2))-methylthiotransferase MtaB [Lachnospiraceae bacterium]|nr:tRNA (N(6)-L-threonylcarbamoyladenosine(37)-C(2))-methylthiotransferase MtaB [Lachnospiraceae bacterium]